MRAHTPAEAAAVVDAVEDWQGVYQATLGRRLVHAADEYYLMADRPFPVADAYEGFAMHEDGIGMARTFELEFTGRTAEATGPRRGFFAAVDGGAAGCAPLPPNPAAYTGLRAAVAASPVTLRPRRAAPVGVLSGELGARVITPLLDCPRARRRPRDPRRQRVLRRQHRGHRADDGSRPRPRAGRRAGRAPLPAARRLPLRRRTVPRRRHRR